MPPLLQNAEPRRLNGQLTAFVHDRADEWFDCARAHHNRASVALVSRHARRVSVIYRLSVTVGNQQHRLVAKQYWDWLGQTAPVRSPVPRTPPRLFARVHVDDKAGFEYAALAAIQKHFQHLGDRRFGVVRPLGVLPAERTIVMDESRWTSLARLVQQSHRFAGEGPARNLHTAMYHAGAWLSRFHQISPLAHTQTRHAQREEFVDSIYHAVSFLSQALDGREPSSDLTSCAAAAARSDLPSQLPLGFCHTDFAPRNVLVDGGASVSAIDTLGRWQAPVYEDLGYFLFALRAGGRQMASQGWWLTERVLRESEHALLNGYFGQAPIPIRAVRLFELQSLLYRWAAIAHSAQQTVGVGRLPMSIRLAAANRFLARYVRRLMKELLT